MTTTITWDPSLHPREASGKFEAKAQSEPELALDGAGEFDLSTFMQEPPTVAEPFVVHQPVIYTDVDGTDIHASIASEEADGFVAIAERTPGTAFDTDDDTYLVPVRYVREDRDISPSVMRRQKESLSGATELAKEMLEASDGEHVGLSQYEDSLRVRDTLKVGGRTDWLATHQNAAGRADRALDRLWREDQISGDLLEWAGMDEYGYAPTEIAAAAEKIWDTSVPVASAAMRAKMLEPHAEYAHIESGDIELLTGALNEGFDLGRRRVEARGAAQSLEEVVAGISNSTCEATFPGTVAGLSKRRALAYQKAVEKADEAFDVLERYELIDSHLAIWGRETRNPATPTAKLVRAAGQAEVLRHYKPETGMTDEQLDAITAVFNDAVRAAAKSAA